MGVRKWQLVQANVLTTRKSPSELSYFSALRMVIVIIQLTIKRK